MPQHVTLSNGHQLDIPDGTSGAEIQRRVGIMEGLINPQWKGFGNFSNAMESIRNVGSYVTDPAGRIAAAGLNLNPAIGGTDLAVGGINAAKSVASKWYPSLNKLPDVPSVSGLVGDAAGVKENPNPSMLQRYGEAALTGILNPRQALGTAGRMISSTAGGDVGGYLAEHLGGPEWEKFGRWLGSIGGGSPDLLKTPAVNTSRWMFAGPQAQRVDQSAQGVGVRPSFVTLANTPGRYLSKALAAVPFAGNPSLSAQTRIEQAVEDAKTRAAEQINQGPLPTQIDPNSVGGNLISLARARSASIKQDADQRFIDLSNAVGRNTPLNANPLLRGIDAMIADRTDPNMTGDQISALQDLRSYINDHTYGNQYYRGPTQPPGALQPTGTITLGQLSGIRSQLGADIQGMRPLNTVSQGRVRDLITGAMRDTYNRTGYGQQFDDASQNYARTHGPGTVTDALDQVGGAPVKGKPGIYEGGMNEKQAFDFLKRNTQSESAIEPFVDPNSPYWRAAAAQFISTLGETGQGGFRADTYGKEARKISDPVLTQMTAAPTGQGAGGPLQPATSLIRQAQDLGENSSVAVSRHGLTGAVGSSAALWWLANHVSEAMAAGGLPRDLLLPATIYGISKGLESQTMTDAMAGRTTPTPLVDALYQGYPHAAASLNLNNPDDPRLGYSVTQSPPPSPLDALKTPQPQ